MYFKKLHDDLIIRNAKPADAEAMGALQKKVFPTLSAAELMSSGHFASHIKIFKQGQIVIEYKHNIIASTSTLRCQFPPANHTFLSITADRTIESHDPQGEWMYGIDIAVEPNLQGLGLGRYLYIALSEIARDLGLAGQVTVGMPIGYGKVKDKLSFEEYYRQILSGEVFDPTVSMQMKIGFVPTNYISNYLNDPKCADYGVMMKLEADKKITEPKLSPDLLVEKIEKSFKAAIEKQTHR